jgi:hypothetical protein
LSGCSNPVHSHHRQQLIVVCLHYARGFASPASGEFNSQLKQEFTATIEQLLAEKQGGNLARSF